MSVRCEANKFPESTSNLLNIKIIYHISGKSDFCTKGKRNTVLCFFSGFCSQHLTTGQRPDERTKPEQRWKRKEVWKEETENSGGRGGQRELMPALLNKEDTQLLILYEGQMLAGGFPLAQWSK